MLIDECSAFRYGLPAPLGGQFMSQDTFQDQSEPSAETTIVQEFPLYAINVGNERFILTLTEAATKLNQLGFDHVESGETVVEGVGSRRPMTDADQWRIAEAATLQKIQANAKKYPRYQLIVNGETIWYTLGEAAAAYDNGFTEVDFGKIVHDSPDEDPREMTLEDQQRISQAADEYSASK